jgi:hypothetical protein
MVTPRTAIWAPNWPPASRATGIDAVRYHGESFMLSALQRLLLKVVVEAAKEGKLM